MWLLAWTPVLEPMDLHDLWWLTLLPLALLTSTAYKAIRLRSMSGFGGQVLTMTVQIVAAMFAIAVGLWLLAEVLVPMVA